MGKDVREVLEPGAAIEHGKDFKSESMRSLVKDINIRIGVHTGRVIAGVVGSKLVRYDIFGEGVIVSHRVEIEGQENKVVCSDKTKSIL